MWYVEKEFRGKIYEKDKTYTVSPYVVVQYQHLVNEDYSRSLCEEHIG